MVEAVRSFLVDVAGALFAAADDVGTDDLEVVGLAEPGHGVDEDGGEVEAPAQLAGGVVPGEGVVVVVEALADGADDDGEVLARADVAVVGLAAPHVRGAVHQPRHVERPAVAEDGAGEEGDPLALAPAPGGDVGGQQKATEGHQRQVESKSKGDTN